LLSNPLLISGKRYWRKDKFLWKDYWDLDKDSEPSDSVAIRYENTYGGSVIKILEDGEEEWLEYLDTNPIGKGIMRPDHPDEIVETAQILHQGETLDPKKPFTRYHPAGYGFINRSWEPRVALQGTLDDDWKYNTWPFMPKDYDEMNHQGAHKKMRVKDYFQYQDEITLTNLTKLGLLRFKIPKIIPVAKVTYDSKKSLLMPLFMDTCVIDVLDEDTTKHYVYLSGRTRIPLSEGMNGMNLFHLIEKDLMDRSSLYG